MIDTWGKRRFFHFAKKLFLGYYNIRDLNNILPRCSWTTTSPRIHNAASSCATFISLSGMPELAGYNVKMKTILHIHPLNHSTPPSLPVLDHPLNRLIDPRKQHPKNAKTFMSLSSALLCRAEAPMRNHLSVWNIQLHFVKV